MRSFPLWAAMAMQLLLLLQLTPSLHATSAAASSGQWQRSLLGRNSRNLRQHNNAASRPPLPDGGPFETIASNLNSASGYGNEYGQQLFAPFAIENRPEQLQQLQQQTAQQSANQAETEVYGIVEPLIEDTPCANRPCRGNDDCCPTGVCVNTYGEGKCVYVFGRQRDLCQRHADCAAGSACILAPQQGIWRCEQDTPLLTDVFNVRQLLPLGAECTTSSDCQVINGMCCQQQRLHHRAASKLSCGYFRDAFDCVNVPQEHLSGILQHRRN